MRENTDPRRGMTQKYEVKKLDDPAGKHDECRYFVLDPQHDDHARVVLLQYATLVRMTDGNDALYNDIHAWLTDIERRDNEDLKRRFDDLSKRMARMNQEHDR